MTNINEAVLHYGYLILNLRQWNKQEFCMMLTSTGGTEGCHVVNPDATSGGQCWYHGYSISIFIERSVMIRWCQNCSHWWHPGGRLNIKMSSYQYKDPPVKHYKNSLHLDVVDRNLRRMGDKTVSRPSYLWHWNPHTWVRRSLFLENTP